MQGNCKKNVIVGLGVAAALLLSLAVGCGDRALGQSQDGGTPPDALASADSAVPRSDVVAPGEVTVFTDTLRYALGDSPKATVHNGTNETIYLGGCGIFDMHELVEGKWVDHGSAMDCYWEGKAQPLAPGESREQGVFFDQPGRWRVALRYGVGCDPNLPLSAAACTRLSTALSAEVQVEATAKDCEEVATRYAKAVQYAQTCQPSGGKMPCTVAVPQSLYCGCDVPIDDNSATQVKSWSERWQRYDCAKLVTPTPCPPRACEAALPADCVNGRCQTR